MSAELLHPELIQGAMSLLSVAVLMAYSDASRSAIFKRAQGYCEEGEHCSLSVPNRGAVHQKVFPHSLTRPIHASDNILMQAAHGDHRGDTYITEREVPYDDPRGGLLLCPEDHFIHDAFILSGYLGQDRRTLSPGDIDEKRRLKHGLLYLAAQEMQRGDISYAHSPDYFEKRGMVAQQIVADRIHNPDVRSHLHPWVENLIAWIADKEIEQDTLKNMLVVCEKLTGSDDFGALQAFVASLEDYEVAQKLPKGTLMWHKLWHVVPFHRFSKMQHVKELFAEFKEFGDYQKEKPPVRFMLFLNEQYGGDLKRTEPAFNVRGHAEWALKLGLTAVIASLSPEYADYAEEITAQYRELKEKERQLFEYDGPRRTFAAPIPGLPGRRHDDSDLIEGVDDEGLDRIAREVAAREGLF